MPTYLGYKTRSTGIINWAEATAQLSEDITQALNTRALEREAFDEINQTNVDEINSYELGQNQTFNEYVLRGADDIRTQMYEWNQMAKRGEITRADYKSRMNNAMSDWGSFANAAKNFDKRHEEIMERQRTGKGSAFEAEINKHNAMMADLGNKGFYVNPTTGRVYNAEYDENGVIVNATGAHQTQMPGNLLDDSLNLATSVQEHVKTFGNWKKFEVLAGGATRTTESKRLMEDYERLVETTIDTYMTDPRTIAKILVDNGTGEYVWDEDQLKAKIDAKVDREKEIRERVGTLDDFNESEFRSELEASYVLVGQDETGTFQPQITEDQIELARQRVRDEIDKQTGVKTSGTKAPTGGRGNNGDSNEEYTTNEYSTYAALEKDWDSGNFAYLESQNPNMQFRPEKGVKDGKEYYKVNIYSKDDNERSGWRFLTSARSAEEMLRYYYKPYKGLSQEAQYYAEQKAYQKAMGIGGESSGGSMSGY
jgi:hypothetical protein